MLLQSFQPLLPGVGWEIEIAEVPQTAIVTSTRGCALRFFELLRRTVTGARPLPVTATTSDTSLDDTSLAVLREREMAERLAIEVYMDHQEAEAEAWVIVPDMLFQMP